jgi:hypothetical protein
MISRRPKVNAFARRAGSGNPPIKHIAMVDKPTPPKRPSSKPKRLRAQITAGKARAKEKLSAMVELLYNETAIAKALHGPRAKSRRKLRRDGNLR